jgi:ATP/maltotriose-dependent transcriptional regulator MalT
MRRFAELLERGDATVSDDTLAHALRAYGSATDVAGEADAAFDLYTRSLALFERLGDEQGRAVLLHRLGIRAMRRGQLDDARDLVAASHEIHKRNDDLWGLAQTIGTKGALERDAGSAELAYGLIARSAELAQEVGVVWWQAGMLIELAALSLESGRIDEAERTAVESLVLAQRMHDYCGRVFGVGVLACVAAERGDARRAGRLWGAIEDDRVGAPLGGWFRHREACEAHLAAVAGDELRQGLGAGRELSLDEAVEEALGEG